jgi:hypothetical protein
MAASISQQEARDFTVKGYQDYKDKQFTRSTEQGLVQSNKTYQETKLKEDVKDRLKIGGSELETEQSINQAKMNEDMIAQQKMLEEAQQRIAELERNIKDLKEINDRKNIAAPVVPPQTIQASALFAEFGWILGVIGLSGVFLFGVLRKFPSKELKSQLMPVDIPVKEPILKPVENKQTPIAPKTPTFEPKPMVDEDDPPVNISSAAIVAATSEVPPQAKKIFESVDLNLNSKTEPKKTTINVPTGPFTVDLGVTSPDESTSVSVKTIPLTIDEQRVRLNLAKSYVKIKDLETARILLNDLMNLGSEIESTILEEVKKILLDLG